MKTLLPFINKTILSTFLLLTLMIGSFSSWAKTEEQPAKAVVIHAGYIVNPADGSVLENHFITVMDGKITSISRGQPRIAAQVVDLSDQWVLPGLMDMHTHMTWNQPGLLPRSRSDYALHPVMNSTGFRALEGLRNAQDMLNYGFTLLRDIGNNANYADTDLRKAIDQGLFKGPTIYNAGKIIAPYGGQSHNISPEVGTQWDQEYIDADTPDELVKAIRRNIYYGAKLIKLVNTDQAYRYSYEDLKLAADETHKAGLTLAVHSDGDAATQDAVRAGADSIEHAFSISDETMRLMAEKGTYLVGTDFPYAHMEVFYGPERARRVVNNIMARLKRAWELGVPMAFGTDTISNLPGKNRGQMALDYYEVWSGAGIPAAGIIKAMTLEPAKLLKIDSRYGSIEVGKMADIIAVPQNPLDDIENLRNVQFVMKHGNIIKNQIN